eukprot:TRINITY_DN804_c0_g1_i2.p1 TRINITY_DN804_c0_g1~~TRINITY_DN804_c0_g1_i2.p1  ORF type:complete len:244 (+),score=14.33 TRINITY_DN804_c0_g1_i2:81-812(+)
MGSFQSDLGSLLGLPAANQASQTSITKTFVLFQEAIRNANDVCRSIPDSEDNHLHFEVIGAPDAECKPPGGILWRLVTKVQCSKVFSHLSHYGCALLMFPQIIGQSRRLLRVLTVREFACVYDQFNTEAHLLTSMSSSTFISRTTTNLASDNEEACCICLNDKVDMLLPCCHGYCSACIDQWRYESNGLGVCPLCRADMGRREEEITLVETPTAEEMHTYLADSVHVQNRPARSQSFLSRFRS